MRPALVTAVALLLGTGCAAAPDPAQYRLVGSGAHWDAVGKDTVFADLEPRYPAFFALVLDPQRTEDPDLLVLRDDLEHDPVTAVNYDALNALAIGYFELNYRAQSQRGGAHYMSDSFRAAKLLAVPWRAYSEVDDPALRMAIVDFFEDAAFGGKLETAGTAGRLERVVESLARKEANPALRARIEQLAARIHAASSQP